MAESRTRSPLAMRVSGIRFAADLWRLLGAEAERSGVSVSQYVREAALMRASAAIAARGEDPTELLAEAAASDLADSRRPAERACETARAACADALVLRAEAGQARRHAVQSRAGETTPVAKNDGRL